MRGTRILVTGASRGIGRGVARALCGKGAMVVGVYRRSRKEAAQLQLECASSISVVCADLNTQEGREAVLRACADGLDGAVFSAGVVRPGPFAEGGGEEAEDPLVVQLRSNLESPLLLLRDLAADGCLREGASVVFVGSNLGRIGVPGRAAYAAAKAGLEGAARALAAELGPEGIRVNVVAPGLVLTDMVQGRGPDALADAAAQVPLRRLGTVEDVVGPVLFLLSEDSVYVTGQVLVVDGGASASRR